VISTLPRRNFILLRNDFSPNFSFPVQDADSIETLLVGSTSSENNDLVGGRIIVDGTIGAKRRTLSGGVDLLPGLLSGMVCPEIVHVIGV